MYWIFLKNKTNYSLNGSANSSNKKWKVFGCVILNSIKQYKWLQYPIDIHRCGMSANTLLQWHSLLSYIVIKSFNDNTCTDFTIKHGSQL